MVTLLKRFQWLCAGVLLSAQLHAADLPTYKIGDKAQEDIRVIVPFDVVDTQATAALKATKAQTVAAIYHHWIGVTNQVADQFLKAFAEAHTSFSNYLMMAYHQPKIDDATIEASDFGYLVTAYNVENKNFPVTTQLAVNWAHGDSGKEYRDKWLDALEKLVSQPIQPNTPPTNFFVSKRIRIMPVTNVDEQFTFQIAWKKGYVVGANSIHTASAVRAAFRKEFSENEQPLANALSQFIQPNCFPDVEMTLAARDYEVRKLVVSDHFTTGQMLAKQGDPIDSKVKAALDAMNKELMPGALNEQIAAERERTLQEAEQAQEAQDKAVSEHKAAELALQQQQQAQLGRKQAEGLAAQERAEANAMREQALDAQILAQKIRTRDEWLVGGIATISAVALAVLWWLIRQRRAVSISVPARLQKMEPAAPAVSPELAPFLAQTLKDAVVQGLAAQRAELLETQRMAATEISQLVLRLDQLQAPMQERLRAYQDRIQELQKELADRTDENRELLKLKIEMMRKQLESERGRVNFN
jgi:7TM-HD extracellular